MGQLAYDLQTPICDGEECKRVEWLARHFQQLAFARDYAAINEYVNDCSKSGVKPELRGADVEEWLNEICVRRDTVNEFYRGINPITNSLELMTDYVEYLLTDWGY